LALKERVGIALIGAGAISLAHHLPAYEKLRNEGIVDIVAVADANESSAKAAGEKFDIPNVFTDYCELLKLPDVDAVDICTPNFLHKQPALDAFAAGKHILVEKPLALNGIEGAEMVEAGKRANRLLQVGFNLRFQPTSLAIRRLVDAGKFGEFYYARAHALRRRGVPTWGVFTNKEKQGGGPLIDIGVHILDLSLWLLGHPKVLSVSGKTYRKFGNRVGIYNDFGSWNPETFTVEDFAVGQVKFENGATLALESSFVANIPKNDVSATLLGTDAGLYLDMLEPINTRIYGEESGTLFDTQFPIQKGDSPYELEIRSFVNSIREDKPSLVPGEQALLVSQILDGIYQSSETGKEIFL